MGLALDPDCSPDQSRLVWSSVAGGPQGVHYGRSVLLWALARRCPLSVTPQSRALGCGAPVPSCALLGCRAAHDLTSVACGCPRTVFLPHAGSVGVSWPVALISGERGPLPSVTYMAIRAPGRRLFTSHFSLGFFILFVCLEEMLDIFWVLIVGYTRASCIGSVVLQSTGLLS